MPLISGGTGFATYANLGAFVASQQNCANQYFDVVSKRERKKQRDRTDSQAV